MKSFDNCRNCFSVTAFKECEAMRMNLTESNIIFLNRLNIIGIIIIVGRPTIFSWKQCLSKNVVKLIKNVSTLFYECNPCLNTAHYNCYRTCITEESMLAPFRGDVQKWYGSTKKVIVTAFTASKYRQIQNKYKGEQGEQYSGALHLHKYHLLRSSQRCCC